MSVVKNTILSLIVLVVSLCVLITYRQFHKITDDITPPRVISESDTITVSVKTTEDELLEGVVANDDKCGDVSDTLVIEDISNFVDDNTRIITYAAIDDSLNVGRLKRNLVYTDYSAPTFYLTAPMCYSVGAKVDILAPIGAISTVDGDITAKIRYGLDGIIDNLIPGKYPVEFRVTDSCGKTTYLELEIEIYDNAYSGVKVELSEYLVYIKQGSKFNESKYFKSSTIEGELSIVSDVDTSKQGVYYVDYFVNGVNARGKSRLAVIVY